MTGPIEHLQRRIEEMQTEYERVLNVPHGGYATEEFLMDSHNDLEKIYASIQEFKNAIKILQE